MKTLITGAKGFVGQHLTEYLRYKDYELYTSSRSFGNADIELDLKDYTKAKNILDNYKFDVIFHLSAQSSVHRSFQKPFNTMEDNIISTLNLLKIVHELNLETKVVIAGTSEIYKTSVKPMSEESAIEPRSPYTVSKLAIDYFTRVIAEHLNINVTVLRLFNHTGPGQSTEFVLSSFAQQLAMIKLDKQENVIKVGNLEVQRDFTDVRDVVRAYDLVCKEKEYGECYNVCSNNAYNISDLLSKLIEISNLDVKVEVDSSRLRANDIPYYYGNYDKILAKHGWMPEIPIHKTLEDLYVYWLNQCK